jgi:hypothetical protein
MKEPNQVHFDAMTHLMKYCVSTPDHGRKVEPKELWNGDKEFELVVSSKSDSNFNQCPETRKSVSGNVTKVNGVPVLVKSVMQETMKLSVTEAELDSTTSNAQDMLFVRKIITGIGLKEKRQ